MGDADTWGLHPQAHVHTFAPPIVSWMAVEPSIVEPSIVVEQTSLLDLGAVSEPGPLGGTRRTVEAVVRTSSDVTGFTRFIGPQSRAPFETR